MAWRLWRLRRGLHALSLWRSFGLRGGNAIALPQINAFSLITSGLFGLFYYREIRGWPAVAWVAAAVFTATMSVLLGCEKGS